MACKCSFINVKHYQNLPFLSVILSQIHKPIIINLLEFHVTLNEKCICDNDNAFIDKTNILEMIILRIFATMP